MQGRAFHVESVGDNPNFSGHAADYLSITLNPLDLFQRPSDMREKSKGHGVDFNKLNPSFWKVAVRMTSLEIGNLCLCIGLKISTRRNIIVLDAVRPFCVFGKALPCTLWMRMLLI